MEKKVYYVPSVEVISIEFSGVFAASDITMNAMSIDSADSVDYGEF